MKSYAYKNKNVNDLSSLLIYREDIFDEEQAKRAAKAVWKELSGGSVAQTPIFGDISYNSNSMIWNIEMSCSDGDGQIKSADILISRGGEVVAVRYRK